MSKYGIQGTYQIRCTTNDKVYVGSSVDLYYRERKHFSELRRGVHSSIALQNAYNKHGAENFVFEILEIVENKSDLLNTEQYWIDKLESYKRNKGYNIRKKAHCNEGISLSDEAKAKLSLLNKGKKLSEDHKKKIGAANKGRIHSEEYRKNCSERQKGKIGTGGSAKGENNSNAVEYCFVSPDGIEYKGKNIKTFAEKMNLSYDALIKVHTGLTNNHKGWHLPGVEVRTQHVNAVAFKLRSPEGVVHEGMNVTHFANPRGLCQKKLSSVLSGKAKSHKGWTKAE